MTKQASLNLKQATKNEFLTFKLKWSVEANQFGSKVEVFASFARPLILKQIQV